MRTTRLTKIAMVIFLSMIFFLGVQRPVLAADRNTTVKIPVEQIFEVNNSADADKTGSYVLIADQIQNPMPEGSNRRTFTWNMSGNSSTELIMNVGQAGEYHYKLYQATENKENYTYDSKTYDVTIEGFFDSNNELMAVTVVKNENGDKVSKVSFKNSYTGQTGKNQNPVPSSPRSKDIIHNGSPVKIMNVGQAGEYHYKLYQATENKENYTYDSKTYDVTIEGFFDSNNELMAVTVVKNENGDKVSKVSFKNSYTGQTGKNQNPVLSSPRSKDIIHNGSPVKTGDDSPVAGYLFLFFGSVICLCGLLMEKQKNRKGDAKNET